MRLVDPFSLVVKLQCLVNLTGQLELSIAIATMH